MRGAWLVLAFLGCLTLTGCGEPAPEGPRIAETSKAPDAVRPFTLEQLQNGIIPGQVTVSRLTDRTRAVIYTKTRVVSVHEDKYVEVNTTMDGNLEVMLEGSESDWEFAFHLAGYKPGTVEFDTRTITTALGTHECWYIRTLDESGWTEEAWYAKALPGSPIRLIHRMRTGKLVRDVERVFDSRLGMPDHSHYGPTSPAEIERITGLLKKYGVEIPTLRPFPLDGRKALLGFPVATADAMDTWKKLRGNVSTIGRWPLITAKPMEVFGNIDWKEHGTVFQLVANASDVDPERWLKDRAASDPEYYDAEQGAWADREPSDTFHFLTDHEGKPAKDLWIMLVPTKKPWEVAGWLAYGNWNENPGAGVHVALHRYWHKAYRIEPVYAEEDTLEFLVKKPPTTKEAARKLAREQFLYCADIVHQGVGTLDALAATLKDSKAWFFWWD